MVIRDPMVSEMIIKLSDHFTTNIVTRFLRPLLAGILADNEISRRISELTDHPEAYTSQGIHVDELYLQILAMARFIYEVRTEVLPNLRLLSGGSGMHDSNKVYRDMAMSNFGSNLQVLADYVHELYLKTVEYDKSHSGRDRPVYRDIPGLEEIGRYLIDK